MAEININKDLLHMVEGFSNTDVLHLPEVVRSKCGAEWRVKIGDKLYLRQCGRWRLSGLGNYIGSHVLVKQMIGWHDRQPETISKYEIYILETIVDVLANLLDSLEGVILQIKKDVEAERQKQVAFSIMEREQNEARRYASGLTSGFVYLMSHQNGLTKIGYSTDPATREKTLQAEDPRLRLIATRCGFMSEERRLHRIFADKRVRGEWFNLSEHEKRWLIFLCKFDLR